MLDKKDNILRIKNCTTWVSFPRVLTEFPLYFFIFFFGNHHQCPPPFFVFVCWGGGGGIYWFMRTKVQSGELKTIQTIESKHTS